MKPDIHAAVLLLYPCPISLLTHRVHDESDEEGVVIHNDRAAPGKAPYQGHPVLVDALQFHQLGRLPANA